MMRFKHRSIALLGGLVWLGGCAAPVPTSSQAPSPEPSAVAQPTTAPSAAATVAPSPSAAPAVAAPFEAGTGVRFGGVNLVAPTFAAIDPQQGLVYVADAIDPNVATHRYELLKFNQAGTLQIRNSLSVANDRHPTRVDGIVWNLAGLPIVNAIDENQFTLTKVAGATTTRADRFPVNSLPYARLTASASAENGKYLSVAVLHRAEDSANSGPEYVSLGRAEEDKAPVALYRLADPLGATARLAVSGDGEVFLFGPSKAGKLSVMRIKADRSTETLPIELASIPDQVAVGPDNRLYVAWNSSGGQPAKVRSTDLAGNWSAEGNLRIASGAFLTQVSNMAFDPYGHAVVTGTGFDPDSKSMKAVFYYSK